jgi:hypothetical protein
VPVADQLDHLESGTDFESLFVQQIKKQSHPDNYSYQGIYLAAPNGVLMAGSHEALHDARAITGGGKPRMAREIVERLLQFDPSDPLGLREMSRECAQDRDE